MKKKRQTVFRLGLERVRELCRRLGDPQNSMHFVHVAGTNGKGSASVMLYEVLTGAGYVTGLYTSPFLVRENEEIRAAGREITDGELAAMRKIVREAAQGMEDPPTDFEETTALAFLYLREMGCDIAVVEVGLGGSGDATNVIPAPEVCMIMNMALEHTNYLGNTIREIASVKAGIIKEGCDVVLYPGDREVMQVFLDACEREHAKAHLMDVREAEILRADLTGTDFLLRGREMHINLPGRHQVRNAVMVSIAVDCLRDRGWEISEEAVREGLANAVWPARMELLRDDPVFLLDGAHNLQCMQALEEGLSDFFPGKKIVFIFGILADKAVDPMIDLLIPHAAQFVCFTPENLRALPVDALAERIRGKGVPAYIARDPKEAVMLAQELADGGPVCACGSLYMAGPIREIILSSGVR